MKFTNSSRSVKYTLGFAVVFVFSFISAYCLTGLIDMDVAENDPATVNRQQLFRNYRFLNPFLSGTQPGSLTEIDRADIANPLLLAREKLNLAQGLAAEKKYGLSSELLAQIPGSFPHIEPRRNELQLEILYATKEYQRFIATHDRHPVSGPEIGIFLVDSLLKTGRHERAQVEFSRLFSSRHLELFSKVLPRPALLRLLQTLDEDWWLAKFSYLVTTGARSEFRRELPFCRYSLLAKLFKAEFAYLGRDYGQAQTLLQGAWAEKYRSRVEKLRLKIALRRDPQADLSERLQAARKDPATYAQLAFDLAQILIGQGEFEKALPLYAEYVEQKQEPDEEYWKTIWLLAWIHYRLDRKDEALTYFQKGCASPFLSYRIASRYWHGKLENGQAPPSPDYPFSYYAVKAMPEKTLYKDLHHAFISTIDKPTSPRFAEIVGALNVLVKYSLWQDCAETLRAAASDPRLNDTDRNLLSIIESLIYVRQNRFFQAYASFRGNFRQVESVRLPNFLSAIFFPRRYLPLIDFYSREQQIDPFLVQALIREETFFQADAVSPANAHGLMQLLPGTARPLARAIGLKVKTGDLYDPEINIRIGLRYFKSLLDRYDGRLYLALAAYNAGPHRVDRWLEDFSLADEEEFIEMIPFTETRTYVKNILRNYFFYRYYYDTGKA